MKKENKTIHETEDIQMRHQNFLKVDYYIDKEKGVVVCTISPYSLCNETKGPIGLYSRFYVHCMWKYKVFTGKATCNPEDDIFDKEKGKKIAYDRAALKMISFQRNLYRMIIADAQNLIEGCKDIIDNIDKLEDTVNARLEKKIQ